MRKALKKVMSIALTAAMSVSMLTVGAVTAQADDLKVGVILVGDETEGYTKAHMDGISQAAEELGMDESQIVWKYKVAERPLNESSTKLPRAFASSIFIVQTESLIFKSGAISHFVISEDSSAHCPPRSF